MSARELLGAAPEAGFVVTVDGAGCRAYAGDTLAAVMVRAGLTSWRATRRDGAPRGLFCGIGACQDCLVTVGGVASVRACLDVVLPGDVVTTQKDPGRGDLEV
jgi:predicted molibdopterin-dependent oxidoreductase YjgC